jgi:thymidylate kinase
MRIVEILENKQEVVCDRLLASTIAGHKTMYPLLDTSVAERLLQETGGIKILLTASWDTIKERLQTRETITRFEKDE